MVDPQDRGRSRAAPRPVAVLSDTSVVRWPLAWPSAVVPDLASGETHVWLLDLDAPAGDDLLSPEERQRADAFRFERHRRRYVAAHTQLRELLSAYVGSDARKLVFTEGASGKPELEGHELRFNLAHSESVGVCAVSTTEVGVDVEVVGRDRRPEWEAVAARFFHEDELTALRGVSGDQAWLEFLRIWTLKEACLKAIGLGLLTDPRSFSVGRVAAGDTGKATVEGRTLECFELSPSAVRPVVAALAASTDPSAESYRPPG